MNKTKQDVQLELLQEIDRICEENGLHYFLFGQNAYNAFKNHTIMNGSQTVSVAMTQGEAEKFCKIAQENKDRYVEGLFNNPRFNDFYITYGNINTTDFAIQRSNYCKCHGIHVKIYFIKKRTDLQENVFVEWSPKMTFKKKLHSYLNKRIISNNLWFVRMGSAVVNSFYSLFGGGKRFYKQLNKNVRINEWDELQQLKTVRIAKSKELPVESIFELQKYEVDGVRLNLPKNADAFFKNYYSDDYSEMVVKRTKPGQREIISTTTGYESVLRDNQELLKFARKCREQVLWNRLFVTLSRRVVNNTISIASMTKDQLYFKGYYKDKTDDLLKYNLDDDEHLEIVYEALKPLISSIYKYALKGMTYSVDEKTDKLVYEVLKKRNSLYTLKRLGKINKKRYFVK